MFSISERSSVSASDPAIGTTLAACARGGRPPGAASGGGIGRRRLPGLGARRQVGVDEAVEVAVEHAARVPDLVVGPVVLDHRVRVQDVGADLRAEVDVLGLAALARDLLLAPALLRFDEL